MTFSFALLIPPFDIYACHDDSQKEIADLFGDYGLTGVSLVRDAEGQSKGFAFLEVN